MISMSFNEELEILEVVYQGDITLDDILEYGKKYRDMKYLPRKLNMITDATEANYLFGVSEIPILAKALRDNTKYFESIKSAMIQTRPIETAKSVVMNQENISPNYRHKVFSTRDSAIEWLLLN